MLRRRLTAALLTLAATCSAATAQSLADRVPANAVAYFGWRGTADPGKDYTGSRWEAIVSQSQFNNLIDDTLPKLLNAAAPRMTQRQFEDLQTAVTMARSMVRRPTAVFVVPNQRSPKEPPHIGLICRVPGAQQRDALADVWARLATNKPRSSTVQLTVGDDVGLFWNVADRAEATKLLAGVEGSGATPLSDVKAFTTAVSQSGLAEPIVTAYIDVQGIKGWYESLLKTLNEGSAQYEQANKLLAEAGIWSIQRISFNAGFKDREWETDLFIETVGPRAGVLALASQKAFNPDLLNRIPASATNVSAVRLDPLKVLEEARRVVTAVDPAWGDLVNKGLDAATLAIGRNVERDILRPLGDEWVIYNSPEIGGSSVFGAVLVTKLDEPLKARQGIFAVWTFAANTARTFSRGQKFRLATQSVKAGDVEIQYIATPLLAPSWVIKDGYLYGGLNPQVVAAAVQYKGPSLADNPKFAEALKLIGRNECMGFSFTDTQTLIPDGYGTALVASRTLLGLGDLFAGPTPEMVLPPLPVFLQQAGPAMSVAWADEHGLHCRRHEPFPAASTLAKLSVFKTYSGPAMSAAVLLPSLNRARESANRIRSAAQLRQIGALAIRHANEQPTGAFPSDFGELLKRDGAAIDVFVSPRTDTDLPDLPNLDAQIEWVNRRSDYVWGGKGLTISAAADRPLAWEDPMKVDEGINVLFCDGHVDWFTLSAARELFQKHRIEQTFPE